MDDAASPRIPDGVTLHGQTAADPADADTPGTSTTSATGAEPRPALAPMPVASEPVAAALEIGSELRASDADRDRYVTILHEALAAGRLTVEEHEQRLDVALAARTVVELAPLIRDLPEGRTASAQTSTTTETALADQGFAFSAVPPDSHPMGSGPDSVAPGEVVTSGRQVRRTAVAVLGGAQRKGRISVGSRLNAVALFGGVAIDLTEAVFTERETVLTLVTFCGGIEVKVPPGVVVRGQGLGILGGFDTHDTEVAGPRAPVVVIRGAAVFGGVAVKVTQPKDPGAATGQAPKRLT